MSLRQREISGNDLNNVSRWRMSSKDGWWVTGYLIRVKHHRNWFKASSSKESNLDSSKSVMLATRQSVIERAGSSKTSIVTCFHPLWKLNCHRWISASLALLSLWTWITMQTCLICFWVVSILSLRYSSLCCSMIDLARSMWAASSSGLHCSTKREFMDFQKLSSFLVSCFSDLKALSFSVWHFTNPSRHWETSKLMLLWVMTTSRMP